MSAYQGDEWVNLMQQYEYNFGKGEQVDTQISSHFRKLGKLLEKKSSLFWHIKSFERYTSAKINPFGLRIQIFPHSEQIDTLFKSEWETNLKSCSQEMMNILSREYSRQIAILDTEICTLETLLSPHKKSDVYIKLQATLETNLLSFNKNILQDKETKFWRDKSAFSEERAYRWNNNPTQTQYKKAPREYKHGSNPTDRNSKTSPPPRPGQDNNPAHRGRGKYKRNRINRSSGEQDEKKRIVTSDFTTDDDNLGVDVTIPPPILSVNTRDNDLDPISMQTNKISTLGTSESASRKTLNSPRGPGSPLLSKMGKGLDPFVVRLSTGN